MKKKSFNKSQIERFSRQLVLNSDDYKNLGENKWDILIVIQ